MDLLEAEKLCEFLQKTTHLNAHRKPGPQLVTLLQALFDVESIAIFDADLGEVYQSGEWFDDLNEVLQNIYLFETSNADRETGLIRRPLRMGQLPIGAVLLRGETSALCADTIASIIAITFDRYHAFANESRTESARQTEQMRTTVLDSLAHAYKTPLTAIEAASSGLAAIGKLTSAQVELVTLIEEQAHHLTELTNRLLRTARMGADDLVPRMECVAVAPLVDDVLASLRGSLSQFSVRIQISPEDLRLQCDRNLLTTLLTQYLDNAGKYGDPDTDVLIRVEEKLNVVVFSVRNRGPVIPAAEHERIFDRYFRCSAAENRAPGTGIGLSVAKRAAQAQGGHVWVSSDGVGTTTFYASLPRVAGDGVAA